VNSFHEGRGTSGPGRVSRTFRRGGLRTVALVGVAVALVGALLVVIVLTGSEPRKVDSTAAAGTGPDGRLPASPRASAPLAGGDFGSDPSAKSSTPSGGRSTKRFMGSSKVLIGGGMADASAKAAPFDVRYAYLTSRPAPSSKYYSASRCKDGWSNNWWGCWSPTPGGYVTRLDAQAAKATYRGKPRPQKMLWTWFLLHSLGEMAGTDDTLGAVPALKRVDLLTRYMNDYRFFLQKIGKSHDMIDLEPDFWGFARTRGNLHRVPAKVSGANPRDCGSQEDSVAGLARCLISMARKYAPNAGVGLHLTCWDWPGNMKKCAKDYAALGAKKADFLVADVSDRDAGWYAKPANGGSNAFWTDRKAAANLKWYKTMAESVGKPVVLWQIPLGNKAQNNTLNHYKDDKVDWFFAHMDQVAKAHVAALLFGPGHGEQTTVESDGGNLIRKTIAYRKSGGAPLK
jgi:hypothetical protein